MDSIISGTNIGIWIAMSIVILVFYHKIFKVYYFNLGRGLFKELFFSAIGGMLLTGLALKFSWITAIAVVVVGFILSRKVDSKGGKTFMMILAIILAMLILAAGEGMKESENSDKSKPEAYTETTATETQKANIIYN